MNLFLAVQGLCFEKAFSSSSKQGLLSRCRTWLLIAVASLEEHEP